MALLKFHLTLIISHWCVLLLGDNDAAILFQNSHKKSHANTSTNIHETQYGYGTQIWDSVWISRSRHLYKIFCRIRWLHLKSTFDRYKIRKQIIFLPFRHPLNFAVVLRKSGQNHQISKELMGYLEEFIWQFKNIFTIKFDASFHLLSLPHLRGTAAGK